MKMTKTHVYFVYSTDEFSNFHPSRYEYSGTTFRCVEQGYQYHKAMMFGDTETAKLILEANNPYECKRLGRIIKGFDESTWDKAKRVVMLTHLNCKFSQNNNLKNVLLNTGTRVIVEASSKDLYWGVGFKPDDPLILDANNWTGENYMGRLLSLLRSEYQKEPMF